MVIWSWLEDWGCDLRLCVVDGVRDVGVQHVLVTGESLPRRVAVGFVGVGAATGAEGFGECSA